MADQTRKVGPVAMRALVTALALEGVCILAGVGAFMLTGSIMWIIIGVVAGTGFSVPALIQFVRASEEQNDASG